MGRLLLIARLVTGDIKRRKMQSALLVLMIVATTATLTLGLALGHVSTNQFAGTRLATRGPDVVAELGFAPGSKRPSPKRFAPLLHGHGISATAGPYPVAFVRLTTRRSGVAVQAEGRDAAPAAVDRPLVAAGRWVRPGGAVVEQGLADSLGLHVGDPIRLGGQGFHLVGIALTTAQPFYPARVPGLVWLTRANAEGLASKSQPLGYLLDIRLTSPASAPSFAESPAGNAFADATRAEPSLIEPWQEVRRADYRVVALDRKVLLVGSLLLSMLAIASIAVVVGGRMAEQSRRVGVLKAVGATPSLVAFVLLAENLVLTLAASIAGLVAGSVLAPSLARPGVGLLGGDEAPKLTTTSVAVVIGVAVAIAIAATLAPTLKGVRTSTIRALNDPAHPPRRRPWLIAMSALLPVPLLLGLRLVARRTRRTVLTAAGLTVAVAMVVTAITVQHDLQITHKERMPVGFLFSSGSATADRANHVLVMLSVILVILAVICAAFTAWASVIDTQVSSALARALGATPRQISAGLTTAQLLPGLVAACVGIPAGLLLYQLAGGHLSEARPPLLWLLAVIPGTLVAVAAVTAVPARMGARRSVAEVLRAE